MLVVIALFIVIEYQFNLKLKMVVYFVLHLYLTIFEQLYSLFIIDIIIIKLTITIIIKEIKVIPTITIEYYLDEKVTSS